MLGEYYDLTPLSVDSGNWVFDLKSRELIYVVRNANYFKSGKDGKKWIRFHVSVNYEAPLPNCLAYCSSRLSHTRDFDKAK